MTAAFDGGAVTRPHVWLAIAHRPQPIPSSPTPACYSTGSTHERYTDDRPCVPRHRTDSPLP